MNIHPAGMDSPGFGFGFAPWGGLAAGVMLLDLQIPQAEACGSEGTHQLVAVVLQGLQPGTRCCPHGEQASLEPERAAVGGELGTGDFGPGLPERRQMATLMPVFFQRLETAPQTARPWPRGRHQQR